MSDNVKRAVEVLDGWIEIYEDLSIALLAAERRGWTTAALRGAVDSLAHDTRIARQSLRQRASEGRDGLARRLAAALLRGREYLRVYAETPGKLSTEAAHRKVERDEIEMDEALDEARAHGLLDEPSTKSAAASLRDATEG